METDMRLTPSCSVDSIEFGGADRMPIVVAVPTGGVLRGSIWHSVPSTANTGHCRTVSGTRARRVLIDRHAVHRGLIRTPAALPAPLAAAIRAAIRAATDRDADRMGEAREQQADEDEGCAGDRGGLGRQVGPPPHMAEGGRQGTERPAGQQEQGEDGEARPAPGLSSPTLGAAGSTAGSATSSSSWAAISSASIVRQAPSR